MNMYSVYERPTDRPIVIYGTARECAEALGITRESFYKQLIREKRGVPPKSYEIFEDGPESEEDFFHIGAVNL